MGSIAAPLITSFQVSDRDGGLCRVTGVASLSYWADREEEAYEKHMGYGCFMKCEVAHGMPWNVEQPVRDNYVYTVPC